VSTSTPEWRESGANDVAVGGEEVRIRVAVLVKQLRRARAVGEEKRDGAAREILSHRVDHPAKTAHASSRTRLWTRGSYLALAASSCRNLRTASFGITP
jgi:hypothetical protein